ncbi:Cytochrome c oxidase assembly protein cox11, mitochondrial [Actinomortierella ambigua]|nr:Cytochrome c oxidase assembly protein cox11, mitochondrial [Actinomortierella ambigua]
MNMSVPRLVARSTGMLHKAARVPGGKVQSLPSCAQSRSAASFSTSRKAGLQSPSLPLLSSPKKTWCPSAHSRIQSGSGSSSSSSSPLRTYVSSAYGSSKQNVENRNTDYLYYTASILIATLGLSYAAVPVYRMVCSTTGMGGAPQVHETKFAPERLTPQASHRRVKVRFNSDTSTSLQWTFLPQQRHVSVLPGETALAFYTAENKSDEDVIGIATYNVAPSKVAGYFNKIQCFCFEEQKLMAGEKVDMPIFFFLDPEFATDPDMQDVDTIVLSYTFFKARGMPFEQQPGVSDQKRV